MERREESSCRTGTEVAAVAAGEVEASEEVCGDDA